jgi:hypothetical protein
MNQVDFEILKLRYQDQVELLRFITSLELKVIFGFFTVIAAIVAWLITKAPSTFNGQITLSIIIGVSTLSAVLYLYSQKRRRDEVVQTVINLNEALGLNEPGKFIFGKAINPSFKYRRLFPVYLVAVLASGLSAINLVLNT